MITDSQQQMVARILGGDTSGRLLKRGARGKTVRALQLYLRQQGHDIRADGIFGDKTLAALKAYQTSAGLKSDGKVGAKTFGSIRKGIEGSQVEPRPRPYGVSEVDQMDMAADPVAASPNPSVPPTSAAPDIMRGANSPLLDPNVAQYTPDPPSLSTPDFGGTPPPMYADHQMPSNYSVVAPGQQSGGQGNAFSNAGGMNMDVLAKALQDKQQAQTAPQPAPQAMPMMAGQGGQMEDLFRALLAGR